MERFIYFSVFLTAVFLLLSLLGRLRRKTSNELEKVLYIRNDPGLYLRLLENPKLKLLFSKSTLLQFRLNAYLLSGEDERIKETIALLDRLPMARGERLEFLQKKLSYFCNQGSEDQAEAALKKIEELLARAKGEHARFILKESKLIFDIYIKHDTGLIKELEQLQKGQQGAARGITLYRLAKLNYFAHDSGKAREYLKQAQKLLTGTTWRDIAESALADLTVLDRK